MRRRAQGFTLIEIMVVIAIIAGLISTVVVVVPQMQERQKRLSCTQNLSQLAQLYSMKSMEKAQRPKYDGVALLLSWRKSKELIQGGKEEILLCPGDQAALPINTDEDRKKYDDVDLQNPPDNYCSYAARDFSNHPMPGEKKDIEIFACDRQGPNGRTMHHTNGIVVAFDDGQTKFMDRDALAFSVNDDIVVGPESPNAMLKKVVYMPGKKKD